MGKGLEGVHEESLRAPGPLRWRRLRGELTAVTAALGGEEQGQTLIISRW